MQFLCAHCHSPLPDNARACDRCGAPAHSAGLGGRAAPEGYARYEDPWRGLVTVRPADWRVLYPQKTSVCFASPTEDAWIDLMTLPPNPVVDATQQARLLLAVWPDIEIQTAGATREHAALAFRTPQLEGRVLVRLSPSGCVAILGRGAPGVDVEAPMRRLVDALGPRAPIPREAFVGPEQSFRLQRPPGWHVAATIVDPGGFRQPICRVFADPSGQALLACEPEFQMFADVPDAPAEGGFFATLGRWAQHAAVPLGHVAMPFAGLRPMIERHFLPKIRKALPGVEVVALDDRGDNADLRVVYPNGAICVFRFQGSRTPHAMAQNAWSGGIASWYQAPAEVFDAFEPIFRGIADSVEMNPAWRAQEQRRQQVRSQMIAENARVQMQMSQRQHQHNMQMLHSQFAAGQAAHETRQEIADLQMQGWSAQQASFDASHNQVIDSIREVSHYHAPDLPGGPAIVEASSHFQHVWSDTSGNLFGGDGTLDVPADWSQLAPWKR